MDTFQPMSLDVLFNFEKGKLPPGPGQPGGWRREIFGNDALLLKAGKIGLSVENHSVKITRSV